MSWSNQKKNRNKLLNALIRNSQMKVKKAERELLEKVLNEFLDSLSLDSDGNIKNTLANKRKLQNIDKVFSEFGKTHGLDLAKSFYSNILVVAKFNFDYYKIFEPDTKLKPISKNISNFMRGWLGISEDGKISKNSYLDEIIENTQFRNEVKNTAMKSVLSQDGWMETKSKIQDLIVGGKTMETGRLEQYYRNFVYDTYSQADRATAKMYADGLKYEFASYDGGIIKTSRKFCKQHEGKIFHKTEIEKFDPPEAKQKNYNPFTDLGGYGCRHHLNWIPNSLAFMMRSDAKEFLETLNN